MISISKGSAQQNLSPVEVSNFKVVLPQDNRFFEIFQNFFYKIYLNSKENNYLIKIRDELLPRLMSGEIEVPVKD
jgi:type I restriction enzyme S subunit